ncbi:DDE-type integrase/transposase/recombinase [Streptomyces sp. NPDC001933]|uniref:DDE-type integrase/transposase/recombinase n=1 Tax=Streptomyces sp. NPDC001933 TaxID=3364626 RepID=UPI0036C826F3
MELCPVRSATSCRPITRRPCSRHRAPHRADRWLYLAGWLDLATREIVGYSMADHHRADLVVDALDMAADLGRLEPGYVIHSDTGSECTSTQLREKSASWNAARAWGGLESATTTPPQRASGPFSRKRSALASGRTGPPPAPRSSRPSRPSTTAAGSASTKDHVPDHEETSGGKPRLAGGLPADDAQGAGTAVLGW